MPVRCLSIHAPYQCRHAGDCCSAHWVVRAEPHVVQFVAASGVGAKHADREVFVYAQSTKASEPQLAVAKNNDGTCIFREHRRCTLHVVGGETVLPIGCRHYPRIIRRDEAQTTVTLSHYCPTAASLLLSLNPVEIVTAAPPLDIAEPLDGLVARSALPPLLHPEMLLDARSYAAWEDAVVGVFAVSRNAINALARIAHATDRLREWTPDGPPLPDAVADAFDHDADGGGPPWTTGMLRVVHPLNKGAVTFDADADADALWSAAIGPDDGMASRVVCNYLAARAFGNWIAYQGRGLRAVVAWLAACHDVVRVLAAQYAAARGSFVMIEDVVEAARQADYVMLHTIDSQAFAHAVARIETL